MKDLVEKHRRAVKALGYSDEQADDLIHRLSAIMCAFIDAAWGVHPAQLCKPENDQKRLCDRPEYDRIEAALEPNEKKACAAAPAQGRRNR